MSDSTFTGLKRRRTTSPSVRTAERASRLFITAGGIGTIIAVTLIFLFLIWVVAPLFGSASFDEDGEIPVKASASPVIASGGDEFRLMTWLLHDDGRLALFATRDGKRLEERELFAGAHPTSWSFLPEGKGGVLGFAGGTIRRIRIDFQTSFLNPDAVPESMRDLQPGAVAELDGGVVEVTPERQFRLQKLLVELSEPLAVGESAVVRVDHSVTPSGRAYGVLTRDGKLGIYLEFMKEDFMTGEKRTELDPILLPYEAPEGRGDPDYLLLSGVGKMLLLVWNDGWAIRFSLGEGNAPVEAERLDLVDGDARITSIAQLIGKSTVVVGDSSGALRAWFASKPPGIGTPDGAVMVAGHELAAEGEPVTTLAPSPRSRLIAAGTAAGDVRIYHTTSEAEIAATSVGAPVLAIHVTPKEDSVLVLTRDGMHRFAFDQGYPEVTLHSLFGKVWYEGYPEPEYVWQSSAGTDDFEAKLSLIPLIFGTLKATLYSILIAAPIAFLAAIFTSEFLDPRLRAPVKSVVEMMASLPSVVLGFLAALIIAPFVQHAVPATLASFVTVPVTLLVGARLWQLLPNRRALAWSRVPRFIAIAAAFPIGILLAQAFGPLFQDLYFGIDIREWLSGHGTRFAGGWAFLLLPLSGLVVVMISTRLVGPWLRTASIDWSHAKCGWVDFARLVAILFASLGLSWLVGGALAGMDLDPRGGLLGPYAQRNALIVGFVMGFAIVPIIYTLAEDALSSVPAALKEGSLGAGATPWQTAWRIVIPTAMSGLFGALMVGLGRAVGETMIVLMAAGNTPILDWNIFNGFRTLSANIAVELPEAVKDSAHYRTLFLAALVLFAMTFLINTFAEGVRRSFRKRFTQL